MTSVTRREGFRYGVYLFGYWLAILALGGALLGAGSALIYVQVTGAWALGDLQGKALAAFGGFLAVLGAVVLGSGQFGLAYKLVSDAVRSGVRSRDRGPVRPSPATSPSESGGRDEGDGEARSASGSPTPRAAATGADADATSPADAAAPAHTSASGDASPRPTASGPSSSGNSPPDDESGGDRTADETPTADQRGSTAAAGSDRRDTPPSAVAGDDGDDDGGDDLEPRESPADVASESPIAEELGFNRSDGRRRSDPDSDQRGQSDAADPDSAGEEDPLDMDDWETGEAKLSEAENADATDRDDGGE